MQEMRSFLPPSSPPFLVSFSLSTSACHCVREKVCVCVCVCVCVFHSSFSVRVSCPLCRVVSCRSMSTELKETPRVTAVGSVVLQCSQWHDSMKLMEVSEWVDGLGGRREELINRDPTRGPRVHGWIPLEKNGKEWEEFVHTWLHV